MISCIADAESEFKADDCMNGIEHDVGTLECSVGNTYWVYLGGTVCHLNLKYDIRFRVTYECQNENASSEEEGRERETERKSGAVR